MRTRVIILIVALVLGGLAAVMSAQYLSTARSKISKESEPIEVLVAQEDIPRGVPSEELMKANSISLQEVPKRFVAADAVSSARALEGQVLAIPLSKGQQVTASSFQVPSTAGLAFSIPKDQVALAIPVTSVTGLTELVKPGDRVAVFVTLEPGPAEEPALTKQLLTDIKVLSVGSSMEGDSGQETQQQSRGLVSNSSSQNSSAAKMITLALSPADAEKLVFAEQTGDVWCALLPTNAAAAKKTSGQSIKTILK
jgi:pilus assembly protein CpaB